MSALFSPITLRNLVLPNRIFVSPMCQYSAEQGLATDWHLIHLGGLALSGAALVCIEATAVESAGRITPGCLGIWDEERQAAIARIISAIRRYSKIRIAMQLAHAGRKASSNVPWDGGQQIPIAEGGWEAVAPSAVPQKEGEVAPRELDAAGLDRIRTAFEAQHLDVVPSIGQPGRSVQPQIDGDCGLVASKPDVGPVGRVTQGQ